jgi:hypothetical protein
MSLRERTRPGLGIIVPCLPSSAKAPPSGPGWIHEIKHDGFRILARRDSAGVRLITIVYREACRFGLRRHRVETARLTLPLGPIAALGEGQEPESARCKARG